jgi:competence protein ComEA
LDLNSEKKTRYRIDLNQADREQLLQVPGIGDRTADKIEDYREEHGQFRSKEELTQIHGIGPAKYEKMSDWLTVRPASAETNDDAMASRPRAHTLPKDTKTKKPSKKEENLKEPIDVNQADLNELQRLPGIGPKLAQRILDERAKKPFQSVEDLRRVSGIGPKILERLRPFVKIPPDSNQFALDSSEKSR